MRNGALTVFFALHRLARVPKERERSGREVRREVVEVWRVGTEKRGGGWVKVGRVESSSSAMQRVVL